MVAQCGPHIRSQKDKAVLESVQRRAARWINSRYDPTTYWWTKSSEMCLEELKWRTLEHHRHYDTVLILYSILCGFSPISFNQRFQINSFPTRSHPLMLMVNNSTINAYRYILCEHSFPLESDTIWNLVQILTLGFLIAASFIFIKQLML